MEKTNTSSENIADALKLLDEAAGQKKDELKGLMSDKYTHLRDMIAEMENEVVNSLADAKSQVTHAKDIGVEKVRELSHEVDKSAHQNPWPFIGGTAVISLLFGFILGRTK